MSFAAFWRKNLAYVKLGLLTHLEYRFNFVMGTCLKPLMSLAIDIAFWVGIFQASGQTLIGGYAFTSYLAYLLWVPLDLGGANWKHERALIAEVNSGAVNALLVRPSSFYEFHLGQLLGQKLAKVAVVLPLITFIAYWWELPIHFERLPAALLMGFAYLLMLYTANFTIASGAFFFDHIYSMNTTKNMILWLLSGELIPLDLIPAPFSQWLIALPFSCGIYLPASYLAGRVSWETFSQGFLSIAIGCLVFGLLARLTWRMGLRQYTGTGA